LTRGCSKGRTVNTKKGKKGRWQQPFGQSTEQQQTILNRQELAASRRGPAKEPHRSSRHMKRGGASKKEKKREGALGLKKRCAFILIKEMGLHVEKGGEEGHIVYTRDYWTGVTQVGRKKRKRKRKKKPGLEGRSNKVGSKKNQKHAHDT